MTLAATQTEFMAQVLDEEAVVPDGWTDRQAAGMDIYRNAYRARLVDALKDTFERTLQWVGDDAFRQAAAHHLIVNPPWGWTIDDCALGFDLTLAELFADDPEVGELGWLELAMHRAYIAADDPPLLAGQFAEGTAGFTEADFETLRFTLGPALASRQVAHDIPALWRSLTGGEDPPQNLALGARAGLVVWREGLRPVFRLVETVEQECLEAVADGLSFGQVCELLVEQLGEEAGVRYSGEMLGRWLANGWLGRIGLPGS